MTCLYIYIFISVYTKCLSVAILSVERSFIVSNNVRFKKRFINRTRDIPVQERELGRSGPSSLPQNTTCPTLKIYFSFFVLNVNPNKRFLEETYFFVYFLCLSISKKQIFPKLESISHRIPKFP